MATEAKEVIQKAKPVAPSAGPAAQKTDFLSGNEAAAKAAVQMRPINNVATPAVTMCHERSASHRQ